ncbi:MAG: hypothetical protein HN576_07635 [Bacteriovoracaceae bacterium]|jgi:acid phosphatase type 7|nr:hypothetical protein [Bacteriovoracaceae bacterium]
MTLIRLLFKYLIFFVLLLNILGCDQEDAKNPAHPFTILTWRSQDTSRTMTVNFKLAAKASESTIYYDVKPGTESLESYTNKKLATKHEIKNLAGLHYFQVELDNLQPATLYYYVIADINGVKSKERRFRTLPDDKSNISFITGGDMGTQGAFVPLLKLAGNTSPDFALIGGDITYGNGEISAWPKWITWLQAWQENMVTKDGRDIPIVAAIGNHETSGLISKKAPFYKNILRQHEKTYFIRNFGKNLRLFVLDTGHIAPHFGLQRIWLKKQLKKAKKQKIPYKMAIYHIPLYPSHRKYNLVQAKMGRIFWKSLFEKYELFTAFENHDHTMKRSHLLKDGKVTNDGSGVLYLGDGCFGRNARDVEQPRWYLAKSEAVEHFWHVKVDSGGVSYKAIDLNGRVIDEYRRDALKIINSD